MAKILVILLFLLPVTFGFSPPLADTCDCPEVSNLRVTGQTSTSIAYAWDGSLSATEYKLWYTREEDHYTSPFFYTGSPSYNFTGLTEGHYTFYFAAVCGAEISSFIGAEDIVEN